MCVCVCVCACVCVLGKTYILQLPTGTCIYLLESPAGEPLWLNRYIASPYASAEAPSAAKPTAHTYAVPAALWLQGINGSRTRVCVYIPIHLTAVR